MRINDQAPRKRDLLRSDSFDLLLLWRRCKSGWMTYRTTEQGAFKWIIPKLLWWMVLPVLINIKPVVNVQLIALLRHLCEQNLWDLRNIIIILAFTDTREERKISRTLTCKSGMDNDCNFLCLSVGRRRRQKYFSHFKAKTAMINTSNLLICHSQSAFTFLSTLKVQSSLSRPFRIIGCLPMHWINNRIDNDSAAPRRIYSLSTRYSGCNNEWLRCVVLLKCSWR